MLRRIRISESAVRSSLFRLRRKDIIRGQSKGRETIFSLTDSGKEYISGFTNRLSMSEKNWNGKWFLLSFNIPEKKRGLRNILREELIALGFGRLHTNLWVSPYDIHKECEKIITRLNLKEYTMMFMSNYLGDEPKALAYKVWNLGELSKRYQNYLVKYESEYEEFKKSKFKDSSHESMEALARLLKFKEELVEWGTRDPFLPKDLLPDNWVGYKLEELVLNYLELLHKKSISLTDFDFDKGEDWGRKCKTGRKK